MSQELRDLCGTLLDSKGHGDMIPRSEVIDIMVDVSISTASTARESLKTVTPTKEDNILNGFVDFIRDLRYTSGRKACF